MRTVLAFVAGVAATYVLAVLFYSQLNLGNLVELGVPVDAGLRLHTAVHDLGGMAMLYLPIISLALLLGFSVAWGVLRFVPQITTLGYVLAGFAALYVVDLLLGNVVASGTHPLAVTRTTVGLLSQCGAGAVGGYVFARLYQTAAD